VIKGGFESRSGLNFSGFNFTAAWVVCVAAIINQFKSAVQIYILSYIHLKTFKGISRKNRQLPEVDEAYEYLEMVDSLAL